MWRDEFAVVNARACSGADTTHSMDIARLAMIQPCDAGSGTAQRTALPENQLIVEVVKSFIRKLDCCGGPVQITEKF
jgi:hypothetical protein